MAATGFAIPVLSIGTVFAVDSAATTSTGTAKTTTTTTDTNTTLSTQDKYVLDKRLQSRVADMKTKLTTAQQEKLKVKCKSAQGIITSVGNKAEKAQTARTQAYGAVVANLSTLSTKLKAAGIDTTTLQSEIDTLKSKINTYNTDVANYKQVVADLSTMNCVQDPTSFQASLDAARAALNTVRTDATATRDYIKNTVKPTLETLKKQLTATKTNGGSN